MLVNIVRKLNNLKSMLFVCVFFFLLSVTVYSQDTYQITSYTETVKAVKTFDSDNVKIGVSFTNFTDKLKLADLFPTSNEDFQGVSGSLNFKLYRADRFKLSGDVEYTRAYINDDKVNQIVSGPKLSFNINDNIEVFGSARYGYTEGNGITKTFTKSYGFGSDINISNFFIRPIQVDYQYLEGFQDRLVKLSSGVGIRF